MFRPLKPYQLVVDVVIAGAFVFVALWSELNGFFAATESILASVVTCVLMGAALAVRRASPGLALSVAWAAAIAQMMFMRPPIIADLAIFAVLYAAAAYGSRVTFWAGFASAFVGAVVITGYLFLLPTFAGGRLDVSSLPLIVAVLIAAGFALLLAWTVGALVRTGIRARDTRRAQERAEAGAAAEQERVRIARDMHDVVAHSLAVVIAQADGARYALAAEPATATAPELSGTADDGVATQALGTISATARAALADVRLLLTQLRHSQSDGPQPTIADLETLYAQVRAAGIDLRVDIAPAPPGTPPAAVQLAVYRILQEALTNALRHGDGSPVDVRLAWHAEHVDVEVANAIGSDRPEPPAGDATPRSGHGLIGMRERAQLAGGHLEAAADDGRWVVTASLPVGSGER